MRCRIHQIFYSEATRAANDPGFEPLDHLVNDRPDWREYWPIRRHLTTAPLDEDVALGFFSPKFRQKTTLDADAVHRFVAETAAETDVVLFSPFFDQSAFFLNVFEQAGLQHPGIAPTLEGAVRLIDPAVSAAGLVMSSRDTVFCNYLVAKPRFWRAWLDACEPVFAAAEAADTDLGRALNGHAEHLGGAAPAKVFMIERVASLLLATRRDFKVRAFDPTRLPIAAPAMSAFAKDLVALDALKLAHGLQPFDAYLAQFSALRQSIVGRMAR